MNGMADHPALNRDCAQVMSVYEDFFKHQLRKLNQGQRTAITIHQLPVTRIKRIMKQESCYGMRQVSHDVAPFMAYAVQLFIGAITNLAWQCSARPASRNTLMLKDLLHVYRACSKFDFLIDVATASTTNVPPMPLIESPLSHWSGECAPPPLRIPVRIQTAKDQRAVDAAPDEETSHNNNMFIPVARSGELVAAQDSFLKPHAETLDDDEVFNLIAH